jgi:CheY-like chemotaxis protein
MKDLGAPLEVPPPVLEGTFKIIPVAMLTSSRETPDLIEFSKHGVNAYLVKPLDFSEFMKEVKQLGIFWAAVNEPFRI